MLRCRKRTVGMSVRTGDPVKTVVPKSYMASRRIGTQLGGANRQQRSVGNVSGLASCQVWEAGSGHCGETSKHLRKFRVGTLCEYPERKSLRGSGNTIPQESGCLLHSGDQIQWWQLSHNQRQGHQVQALLVRK